MLLLVAIAHLVPAPAQQADQVLRRSQAALGHLGLTLIALVYVLVVVWQS